MKAVNKKIAHEEIYGALSTICAKNSYRKFSGAGCLFGGDITRLIYHNGRSNYDITALTPCDMYYLKA